jgi:hypothetical protein
VHGRNKNANKILIEKFEGKVPFRILAHRWDDNIKMDIRGTL